MEVDKLIAKVDQLVENEGMSLLQAFKKTGLQPTVYYYRKRKAEAKSKVSGASSKKATSGRKSSSSSSSSSEKVAYSFDQDTNYPRSLGALAKELAELEEKTAKVRAEMLRQLKSTENSKST